MFVVTYLIGVVIGGIVGAYLAFKHIAKKANNNELLMLDREMYRITKLRRVRVNEESEGE